jgi:quercetin dioxygenase-like cupin family protein
LECGAAKQQGNLSGKGYLSVILGERDVKNDAAKCCFNYTLRICDSSSPSIEVKGDGAHMSSQHARGKPEIPDAEIIRILDLVQYQEGAVVSRTLINRPASTVTLFAFDQGEGLSEHTAPFDALVYVLEGEAEVKVSGKPLRTTAGEAVLMPARQPHSLIALSRFKMLLTMIRS